jgi:hypothetical protein
MSLSPAFGPNGFGCDKTRVPVKPAAEDNNGLQLAGLARQIREDGLGHILGQMPVAADQAPGGRADQIDVPLHQLPEGFFRPGFRIFAQQL